MDNAAEQPPRLWRRRWNDEVSWIGGAPVGDEAAEVIRDMILERRLTRFGALATAVAAELLARDSARAGFVAGVGFFRAWYVVAACREIDRLCGVAVAIKPSG